MFELHAETLQANLERQLLDLLRRVRPARVLIARLLSDEVGTSNEDRSRPLDIGVDLRSPAAQFAGCLTGLAEFVRALRLGERQHRGDLGAQFAGRDQVGDRDQREAVGLDEGR